MRKLLCVLLAVIMIFPCSLGVVNAAYYESGREVDGTTGKVTYKYDPYNFGLNDSLNADQYLDMLMVNDDDNHDDNSDLNEKAVEVLGVPVDYIYNDRSSTFFWTNLTAYKTQKNEYGEEVDIVKADISIAMSNINMYFLRLLKSKYSDFKLYTDKNAIAFINAIGKLFNPSFPLYSKSTVFEREEYIYSEGGVSYADEDIFFRRVADLSGFSNVVQMNWIDRGIYVDFKPVLSLLGVAEGNLLPSDYTRGSSIATEIISAFCLKVLSEGPINFLTGILRSLSAGYLQYYYQPLVALFSQKISAGYTSAQRLQSLHELLNLIFNDCDEGKDWSMVSNDDKNNKLRFLPLPETKLALAQDQTEYFLYLMIYFNINAHYRYNSRYFETLSNNVKKISGLETGDTERISKIVNHFADVNDCHIEDLFIDSLLSELTTEIIEKLPGAYWDNIKESLARMIKRIADWLDMWIKIFYGEIEFGEGAFKN